MNTEDEQSLSAHSAMLRMQMNKREPDLVIVASRMEKTYADRRALVYSGMGTKDIMEKYPALAIPEQVVL